MTRALVRGSLGCAVAVALLFVATQAFGQTPPPGGAAPTKQPEAAPAAPLAAPVADPAAPAPAPVPAPADAPVAPAAPAATVPGAPAAPAGVAPAPAAAPTPQVSSAVKLHDLERRVNELKEQIFRSKARLALLKESVLGVNIGGAQVAIVHRNEMGSTYTLIKLSYAIDGAEIFAKSDESGKLADNQETEVYNGPIIPGNHTVKVMMVYRGNGYGVFSYLKGYKFTVDGSYTFAATEGKMTQIKVVGYEKGNPITTDPKDRPAIDFRTNVVSEKADAAAAKK